MHCIIANQEESRRPQLSGALRTGCGAWDRTEAPAPCGDWGRQAPQTRARGTGDTVLDDQSLCDTGQAFPPGSLTQRLNCLINLIA